MNGYGATGGLVRKAESKGVALEDLPLETLREASPAFDADIRAVLAEAWTIPAEGITGGSNRASVEQQLGDLWDWLGKGT